MEEASEFLLSLYRDAREMPPGYFRDSALRRLQLKIPASAALWGDARRVGTTYAVVPTTLHTSNLDDRFLVEWATMQHEDPAVPLLLSNPGRALRVHVPSFYGDKPEMIEMARRYEVGTLSCILIEGLARNQVHWLSLFRPKPDSICSDSERDGLEALMPHLTEAWRINSALNSVDKSTDVRGLQIGVAEAATGVLLRADAEFLTMMVDEWSGFDGLHVPNMLRTAWREQQAFVLLGRNSRIDGRRFGELVYLSGRWKSGVESLTPRQLEIGQLYAQGMSNKEIAQARGLSPSTVRNHLAHIYEALQVHGRHEMAKRLEDLL